MDYIVLTNPEKCVKCMSCVRACEVNANIVKDDYIDIVPEMCIVCGACIEACPEGARYYLDQTEAFKNFLKREETVAIIAPSYVAHYDNPKSFIGALRKIGLKKVYEVSVGAELSSIVITQEIREGKRVIASPCPTLVNYIKKWIPELIPYLSKAVSPMIATAKLARLENLGAKIVFIGPCISKKSEVSHEEVKGEVNLALTFEEMDSIFEDFGIDMSEVEESEPDGFEALYGKSYPLIGGLAKTVSYYLGEDIDIVLEKDTVVIEGKTRMVKFLEKYLKNIKNGEEDKNPVLAEILYCDGGCIGGPGIRDDLEIFEKRYKVVSHTLENLEDFDDEGKQRFVEISKEMDLKRDYKPEKVDYRIPSEEEINAILEKIGMLEEPLNCGACGYHTCRDRAIAVLNGLIPWDLCIQYQMRLMEREHTRKMNLIREEAIEKTKKVIKKQMEIAQEIASLLGETTAETKASLLKVLKIVMEEAGEENEG